MDSDEVEASEALAVIKKKPPTKVEILEAAANTIIESGYDGCTMRAIASRVGMKAGSIYYHFASKDEIIEEVLNIGIETLYEYIATELSKLPDDAPFAQKVRLATSAHLHCLVAPQIRYLQVYDHLPPLQKRKSRKMRGKYAKIWYDIFSDGVWRNQVDATVNLKVLVPFFLGALNRVPEWIHTTGSRDGDVADLAVAILLKGVARD